MTVDPVSLAINAALIAAQTAVTASQKFEGPRLDSLQVTTADYGAPLNHVYGTRRLDGLSCIWAEAMREVKRRRKTKGGKYNEYSYYGTWAVAVCDHEVDAVTRIWFDRNLVYDATGAGPLTPFSELGDISQFIRVHLGAADQDVDPRMSATLDAEFGADSTPAYRGVCYIVFEDVPLEKLGNRLPQVSVEVVCNASDAYPYENAATEEAVLWVGFAMSPDRSRAFFANSTTNGYEIWDMAARARMISGVLDDTYGLIAEWAGVTTPAAIGEDGTIYAVTDTGSLGPYNLVSFPPDGIGAATLVYGTMSQAHHVEAHQTYEGEYLVVPRWGSGGTDFGGWVVDPSGAVTFVVVADYLGVGARLMSAFTDLDGELWLCCANGLLAGNEIGLIKWTGAQVGHVVTVPSAWTSTNADLRARHYRDEAAGIDVFLTIRGDASGDPWALVDTSTFTVTISAAFDAQPDRPEFSIDRPGSRYAYLLESRIDVPTLTVDKTWSLPDWGTGLISFGHHVYDQINHAIFKPWLHSTDDVAWYFLDRIEGSGVTLRTIVEDVAERCGLTVADDIDATDLTQTVQGYSWTQGQGKAILEPLLEAYDSEARPHDFKIEFLRRGDNTLGTLPVADMGAGGSTRYEVATTLDTDLPLKVSLTFADLDRDQQPNTALAQRAGAATDSRRELSLDASTLALDADEARQMADGYLRRSWMKAQEISLSVSRQWSKLEPGDAYVLALDDVERAAKLTRLEFGANGVLTTSWERYASAVHTPTTMAGAPADGLDTAELPTFGYTKGLALDIPLARDSDNATSPFLYLAGAPYSSGLSWPGATFWRSDDGITYDVELGDVASAQVATIGHALSALPDALSTVWDEASTVSVKMFDGELSSDTLANVANGANTALLGEEIIRFRTATLVATDTYQLSGLQRGRRGTEWATGSHAIGDRFVLLSSLPTATVDSSDVGSDFYVRPTTAGGSDGFSQFLEPFTGAALKPYAPCHLTVEESGGDIVLGWTRRTRISGVWRDYQDVPLGEGSEAYVVQILNGADAVIRTISGLSSPAAIYTAAQQATDSGAGVTARVMQVSSVVGNGFPADIAI